MQGHFDFNRPFGRTIYRFSYQGLNLNFIQESQPLGTGGALWNAVDELADEFILLWGDDLHPIDYKPLVVKHRENQGFDDYDRHATARNYEFTTSGWPSNRL